TPLRDFLGRRLQEGINAFARLAGLAGRIACSGDPARPAVQCRSADGTVDPALLACFQTEAARRGVRVCDVHNLTQAHDVAAVERTLQAYAGVFKALARLSGRPRGGALPASGCWRND